MQATAPLAPDVATNGSRRSLVAKCFLVGAVVLAAGAMAVAAQSNPPSVLVILVDDIGFEHWDFYDAQFDQQDIRYAATPSLTEDWLPEMLRFDDAWSNPRCSPTRNTIMTGKYGFRTGVGTVINQDGQGGIDTQSPDLLPKLLRDAGYATAAFGKWHLGTNPEQGDPDKPDCMGRDAPIEAGFEYFDGFFRDQQDLINNPGYEHYMRTPLDETEDCDPEPNSEEFGYQTFDIATRAINWINAQTEPWFAYVAFNAAHRPYHCPPTEFYDPPIDCGDMSNLDKYHAAIEALDCDIDRLLTSIGSGVSGVLPANTFVVIANENGSPCDPTKAELCVALPPVKMNMAKGTVGQGGVRTLLLIGDDDAGIVPANDIVPEGTFLGLIDLYATILEVANVPLPPGVTFNSVSLVPYFSDPDQPALRTIAFTEVFEENFDPDDGPNYTSGQRAVRKARYKYIRDFSDDQALFDLQNDEWENFNLLKDPLDPDAQQALEELEQALDDLVGVCTLAGEGEPCTSDADCCSGVCQGPAGQETCREVL